MRILLEYRPTLPIQQTFGKVAERCRVSQQQGGVVLPIRMLPLSRGNQRCERASERINAGSRAYLCIAALQCNDVGQGRLRGIIHNWLTIFIVM